MKIYLASSYFEKAVELKIIHIVIIAVIAILGIVAGVAKLVQTPQEMEFLQDAGLSPVLIMVFACVQLAGGLLLVLSKTRLMGAALSIIAFGISSVLIFDDGNTSFGLISLVPVALASLIFYRSINRE